MILLRILGRQLLRITAGSGHCPDVYVSAPLAAEEDSLTVRRDQGIAKSTTVAVIKEVCIPDDDFLFFPVQRNLDDVVVLPLVIQPDVEDVQTVGVKTGFTA